MAADRTELVKETKTKDHAYHREGEEESDWWPVSNFSESWFYYLLSIYSIIYYLMRFLYIMQ